jgi:hypothetical protein
VNSEIAYIRLHAGFWDSGGLIADLISRLQLPYALTDSKLAERPQDKLSDGKRLLSGTKLPNVRPELLC